MTAAAASSGIARRLRNATLGVVIVIVALVGTVFVLEGSASLLLTALDVRTAQPSGLRAHTRRDTLLAWAGKPNYKNAKAFGAGIGLSTDDAGRRRAPSSPGARPSTTLVCSGDSFVLGLGVDDAHPWCALLEGYFDGLHTVNMGQADYGLDQAYLWYRRDGAATGARTHLFAVTATELERATSDNFQGRDKPYLAAADGGLAVRGVPVPVQSATQLRRFARWRTLDRLKMMRILRQRRPFDRDAHTSALVDGSWPVFERMFDQLATFDSANGTQLVLVYLPAFRDRRPSHLDVWRDTLAAYAGRRHLPYVDLTREFRALTPDSADNAFFSAPSGGTVPYPGQYTDFGQAWVARTLSARLPAVVDALKPAVAGRP